MPASLHEKVTKYQMHIDQFGYIPFLRIAIWKEKKQYDLFPFQIATLQNSKQPNSHLVFGHWLCN